MKKLALIIFVFSTAFVQAQKIKKSDLLSIEKNIYKKALQNYDLEQAKNSVYHILELEGQESTYLDSLAYIYFNQKNYAATLKTSNEILKKQEKAPILEMKAISLENLNMPKEAIDVYEKIFTKNKNVGTAFKLASLQQQLKRSAEAYGTLKSAEKLEFPPKAVIYAPTEKKGKQQAVNFQAAYYNLTGIVAYDLHNYDIAIEYFDKALKLQPDYFIAKQNKQAIKIMKNKLEQNSPPPAKNNKPEKADK